MPKRTIKAIVQPDGTVEMEASGYDGVGCIKELRGIGQGMRIDGTPRRKKEFFKKEKAGASRLRKE